VPVIGSLDLTIDRGSCVGIRGVSGSGKSTVLDLIAGLLFPSSGQILVDGESLATFDLEKWRLLIGFVPQQPILFFGSVADNVGFGQGEPDGPRVERALARAGIDVERDLRYGLATNVGEGGGSVSGGQRQRIAIARALYRDPEILILDEVTSAQDRANADAIGSLVESLKGSCTILIVSHSDHVLRVADQVVSIPLLVQGDAASAPGE
jgi:ABC-type bacteriocin/lantibiotic exporter with double-glycine peptidase domain